MDSIQSANVRQPRLSTAAHANGTLPPHRRRHIPLTELTSSDLDCSIVYATACASAVNQPPKNVLPDSSNCRARTSSSSSAAALHYSQQRLADAASSPARTHAVCQPRQAPAPASTNHHPAVGATRAHEAKNAPPRQPFGLRVQPLQHTILAKWNVLGRQQHRTVAQRR